MAQSRPFLSTTAEVPAVFGVNFTVNLAEKLMPAGADVETPAGDRCSTFEILSRGNGACGLLGGAQTREDVHFGGHRGRRR